MLAERVAKVQVAMHDHLADPHPAPAWLEVRPQRIDALVQAAAGGGVVDGRHGALQANPAAAGRQPAARACLASFLNRSLLLARAATPLRGRCYPRIVVRR